MFLCVYVCACLCLFCLFVSVLVCLILEPRDGWCPDDLFVYLCICVSDVGEERQVAVSSLVFVCVCVC